MLQNIRDKSQGWLAWLIVGLLIATFGLWGIHSYVGASKSTNIAAKVNGTDITPTDVTTSYERLRQQQQVQLGADFSLNPAAELQLKQQALQQLIISNVLITAANEAGYRVTMGQVNEALLQIPAFQVAGQFSLDRFHEILNGILYTQDQFVSDMRQSMLINQVQGGYVNSAFALPDEINTAIRLVDQKRDISYLVIPAARFAKEVNVTPAESKQYYQDHQSAFQSPEQVSIEYLELSLPTIKAGLHFDQTKLQQFYENNLQSYTEPAGWHIARIFIKIPASASTTQQQALQQKAQQILAKLKSGVSFATLAKQYSDDTASAAKGGEMPWFSAGSQDPALEKAVANLQTVGAVSQLIKTADGINIIQLLGQKKNTVLPFAQVKDQVANALAEQQAEQIFADSSDKLSNLTYANPDSLDVAAKALGLQIQTSSLFDRQGTKTGITANPKVIAAAFSNDVLQQHNNSDALQIDNDTEVVVRVKDHHPATVLPFADVQNTIQSQLATQKAEQQAEQLGQQLLSKLQQRQLTPQALSKQYALTWQDDNNVGRYDSRVDSAILATAFSMPHPTNTLLSLQGLQLPSGDYALIHVDTVHDGSLANDNIQQRIFAEEIEKNYGAMDYELYVKDLMKRAKIKIYPNALTDDNTTDDNT